MTIVNLAMDHEEDRQPRYMSFLKVTSLFNHLRHSVFRHYACIKFNLQTGTPAKNN